MNKRISILTALAVAAVAIVPAIAFSQIPNAVVHDARGNQVKSTNGECVRTLYGNHDEDCGAVVAPKPVRKLASVYFDFNKSTLTKKGEVTLNKLLAQIKHEHIEAVTIAGYADSIGSDSYNVQLSKKRAETVKHYLNTHGFKHTNVDLRALGKKDAEAKCTGLKDGKLHACMQEDRRVDIELSVLK